MRRTIEKYKMRKYQVLYSWYSYGQKWYDLMAVHARTKKAVYAHLKYDPVFELRARRNSATIQIEKVMWIRPPKPEDDENA